MLRLWGAHFGMGFIALAVVIATYGGSEMGVPLGKHRFQSQRMRAFAAPIAALPSPFPKQFLIGIDEQQIDLENGYPTYFMGTWYPDGVWWYYLAGLVAKEQLVFSIGLVLAVVGGVLLVRRCGRSDDDRQRLACFVLCVMVGAIVLGVLSLHSRMALNVRYAFPALPAIYLAIGIGVSALFSSQSKWWPRFAVVMGLIVAVELAMTFPNYFAYANPMFGGSYRVPPVLHDSNFDGGQDLWRLENWLADHPAASGCERYVCVHNAVPLSAMRLVSRIPTNDVFRQVINEHRQEDRTPVSSEEARIEIVVMRGLGVPAPWTTLAGDQQGDVTETLQEMLRKQPDEFLTPTVAVYRSISK